MKAKQHKAPKNVLLSDMHKFWLSVNWLEWWEEFYLTITPEGSHKYRNIWQFVADKAKNQTQREFLWWYLGAEDSTDPRNDKYPFTKPDDWEYKRKTRGWCSDRAIEPMVKNIRSKIGALEATKAAGDSYTLKAWARLERYEQRIYEEYIEPLFTADITETVRRARHKFFLSILEDVDRLRRAFVDSYAKSNGINYQDMQGFTHILAASAMMSQTMGMSEGANRVHTTLTQLNEMILLKAKKFNQPLPQDMEDKIVEVAALPAPVKKNVQ